MLEEFNEALLENHNLTWSNMASRLFNIHVPMSELDLTAASSYSVQTKCNELEKMIAAQKKMIDANATTLGNLKVEMDRKKYGAEEMGGDNLIT